MLLAQSYSYTSDYVDQALKLIDQFIDEKIAQSNGIAAAGASKIKK